jgi:hypothetical protein
MTAPYKACPRCGTAATLDAPRCSKCGRIYRTQFVAPNQTQAFGAVPKPAEPHRSWIEDFGPPDDAVWRDWACLAIFGVLLVVSVLAYAMPNFSMTADETGKFGLAQLGCVVMIGWAINRIRRKSQF